jgi:hypothetical protein
MKQKRLVGVACAIVAILCIALAVACDGPSGITALSTDNVMNKVYDATNTALRANLITSVPAGTALMGKVGLDQTTPGTTNLVSAELITRTQQNPLITAGAYSANDAVGNILTFTNASRAVGLGGTVVGVVLQDADKESAALELWLFDVTFTQTADNGGFDVADAYLDNCIGVIPIAAVDYNTANDSGVATIRNVNLPYSTIAGTDIYGQLRCTGAPTFGNTRDLTVTLVMRWN